MTKPIAPALDSRYEEEPKTKCPLYYGYKPWDGVPYKVQDEDSFERLASLAGIPAWSLIDYNFGTNKNPRHVNWYLRNFVGCKSTTWDNKNYSFTADADPGIIYFPQTAYKRLIAKGKKPTPFFCEDEDFEVAGFVPRYNQVFSDKTCWAVAGGMLISWKRPHLNSLRATLEWAEGDWLRKFENNESLDAGELRTYADDTWLAPETSLPQTIHEWANALDDRGPLMTIQPSSLGFVHFVVVVGYRIRVPNSIVILYREPGNGTSKTIDFETFMKRVEVGRGGGRWPVYYWAKW